MIIIIGISTPLTDPVGKGVPMHVERPCRCPSLGTSDLEICLWVQLLPNELCLTRFKGYF